MYDIEIWSLIADTKPSCDFSNVIRIVSKYCIVPRLLRYSDRNETRISINNVNEIDSLLKR